MVNFIICEFYVNHKKNDLGNGFRAQDKAEEPIFSFDKHRMLQL